MEGKIRRYEDRLAALSKRYEWTLSSEECRSKKRLQSALKKLAKQLSTICVQIQRKENDESYDNVDSNGDEECDDDLTMTTMSSSDTLSTMCSSGFESQPDSYSRSYVPMMPLIPPTPTKAEPSTPQGTSDSPDPSTHQESNSPPSPSSNHHHNTTTNNNDIHNDTKSDDKDKNAIVKPVAYSFSIPKGLLHGISLMFIFGVCTKWYITLQHKKR